MLGEDLYVTALAFCEKGYEFELLSGRIVKYHGSS